MWVYQLLTILLIFALPIFPKQYVDVNNPSLIVSLIILFSSSLLPIFFITLLEDIKRKFIPTLCFIAFLIPLAIATIFSVDKEQSIFQLRLFLSYFVIFVTVPVIFRSFRSKEFILNCFLLIVTCLSLISLYNTLVRHLVNKENVSFLWIFFGHNHLSALLVFAIPLCLYLIFVYFKNSKVLPLIFATLFIFVISLFFTFSLGAMISLTISLSIALLLFEKTISFKKFPLKKVFLATLLTIALIGIISLYLFSETKGIKTIKLRKDPSTYVFHRFVFWQRAFDNFLQKPLTGSGLDTFGRVTINQTPPFSSYTHNFFIQILSDTGIFGFLTLTGLIGAVFWRGYNTIKNTRNKRKRLFYLSLFVGLLSSTIFAAIDFDWQLPTVFLIFWIFASILSVRSESKDYAK